MKKALLILTSLFAINAHAESFYFPMFDMSNATYTMESESVDKQATATYGAEVDYTFQGEKKVYFTARFFDGKGKKLSACSLKNYDPIKVGGARNVVYLINGTAVKMIEFCTPSSDEGINTFDVTPATDRGDEYVVKTMKNSKFVSVSGTFSANYDTKGFTKYYDSLSKEAL